MSDAPQTIDLGDRPIQLTQLLKRLGWADHGGHAKALIADGLVRVNGTVETRKRRQLAAGDRVELDLEGAPPPVQIAAAGTGPRLFEPPPP